MSKQMKRRLVYPLFLLLAALLVAGCASGGRESADEGRNNTVSNEKSATQSPQPEAAATGSPAGSETAAASTAEPAAPDNAAASAAPGTPAPEASAAPAATAAPAGSAAPAAASPDAANPVAKTAAPAVSAPAKPDSGKSPAVAPKPAATAKPAATVNPAAITKPAATAKPAAAAKPPAATAAPTQPAAAAKPAEQASTVTLSITGDEEHGTILAAAAYELEEGDTVLELLKRITRKNKIQMEYKGAKSFAYVEGIDNLYEFDRGAESGWMYSVNGEFPGKGAGTYTLNPGDTIEWLYTLDLGKDLGAKAP
ncbi:hypothetical protein C2I18_16585 [Paenibacillus sp. PK3_47]|uniref:DUF4430 domain-containing protein n=1 Tax=Paenibacillus sp. PK3_47 TaxID=2072642 RepID=UPI00201DB053|nr:DUF4430 domain-containing protein [Paenibacillus sp. PK3_47]UQZ34997.1 hypothetical protein C2I18_16585 [Paenibacillus sp. PK3_47]